MKELTIGKLAKRVGVSTDTVRFYERCGLLQPPARTASNYRLYPEKDVLRLAFIKRAKHLGFTLSEIKDLLTLRYDPQSTKRQVKTLTENKIEDIRNRIADLQRILATLEHLAETCDGHGLADDCPILAAMDGNEKQACIHAGQDEPCMDQSGDSSKINSLEG